MQVRTSEESSRRILIEREFCKNGENLSRIFLNVGIFPSCVTFIQLFKLWSYIPFHSIPG